MISASDRSPQSIPDTPAKRPNFFTSSRSLTIRLRLRGIFFQVVVYQDRRDRDVAVPFIVVKRVEVVPRPPPAPPTPLWIWAALVVRTAATVGLLMMRVIGRPPPPELDTRDLDEAPPMMNSGTESEPAVPDEWPETGPDETNRS